MINLSIYLIFYSISTLQKLSKRAKKCEKGRSHLSHLCAFLSLRHPANGDKLITFEYIQMVLNTYPVMYSWSSGGPTGSAPSDMGHAMCSNESRTITSQAVTCVVPVHSETRSHRTNRPRLLRFLRRNIVIVSNLCCWLLLPLPPGIAANARLSYGQSSLLRLLHPKKMV